MNNPKLNSRVCNEGSSRVNGFTLLELMIVLVIVSILFTFVSFTIRGHSPEESMAEEARRLDRLVQLVLEEAVLKNTEYGLEFKRHSYRFLSYEDEQWRAVSGDRLLRERQLPNEMEIELAIEQLDVVIGEPSEQNDSERTEEELKPQVFLLSSEEITPEFTVYFSIRGIATGYQVSGSIDGKHEARQSDF
ncbi:MAG: type II secretion system minor pseudopilin GspH [Gammaproteobacteria bacterium]|nr:type II secretion system minor pseudopilin GspH [Gammaproteobacteria bacterium]